MVKQTPRSYIGLEKKVVLHYKKCNPGHTVSSPRPFYVAFAYVASSRSEPAGTQPSIRNGLGQLVY